MAGVSQGTYEIGGKGSGAPYFTVAMALQNIIFPLTGDLTFEVISYTGETTTPPLVTGDLGGHKLRITSVVPHRGRPGAGNTMRMYFAGSTYLQFEVWNGELELDNLEIAANNSSWYNAIRVTGVPTGTGDLVVNIHDILLLSDGEYLHDNSPAILISMLGAVGTTMDVRMWNVIANIYTMDSIGPPYGAKALYVVFSPSFDGGSLRLENSVFRIHGDNPDLTAVHIRALTNLCLLTNVVAISECSAPTPTNDRGFYFESGTSRCVQRSCAATDASADDAGAYSNPHNNIVVGNEFDSTDEAGFGSYFVPKSTGVLEAGGEAPVIDANTNGIQGRLRPHDSDYSVGAVEGAQPRYSSGTKLIGPGEEFADISAAMSVLDHPLTGPVTWKLTGDVQEVTFPAVDIYWSYIDLNGFTLRITSDNHHEGDPQAGVRWNNAVDVSGYLGQLYCENGAFEIDNIIISHPVDKKYIGTYIELYNGLTLSLHDLIILGPELPLCVYGCYISAYYSDLLMWNVIITAIHAHNPQVGIMPSFESDTAKIEVYQGWGTIENVTVRAYAPSSVATYGVAGVNFDADVTGPLTIRNFLAIAVRDDVGTSQAYFHGIGSSIHYVTGYNCASNDDTVNLLGTSVNPYPDVPASDVVTFDQRSSQFFGVPIADTDLRNGTAPTIPANAYDIRGVPRGGTGIGAPEPLPPHFGDSPFVTNFQVIPTIEGPQILALWSLPNDSDTTDFKLLRKLLNYSNDETDGTELVSAPTGSAPNSYVDLNQTPQRAWAYTAFVRHYCTTYWQADTLVAIEQTVVPVITTGFFYVSRTRGITGSTEPAWPTEIGDTVVDGDVVWECFALNPSWVTTRRSRGAAFTWDSEYMQRLPWRTLPRLYRNEDAKSTQVALEMQQDPDYYDVWRAIHEDGSVLRGEFERFLLIFGAALSRVKGATDFYPKLVDPDECLPQYLPQLAGLLGWELSTQSPTAQQRQEILSAVPVYKVKGTTGSIEPLVRAATAVQNVVVDPMSHHILMSNRINRLSAQGVDGLAYPTWTPVGTVARGDIVVPSSLARTGYYYQARQGGTSAAIEPGWASVPGEEVSDGTVIWRTRQFSAPHLTATASVGATSITVDSTAEFTVGKTVNIRDDTTPSGEEKVIADIPDSTTLDLTLPLANSYSPADDAKVTPAYDWYDDETGFVWDRPVIEDFAGVDPSRVRVVGDVIEPSELYSFEFLRIWFILQAGESVSVTELERLARLMEQFAPADTEYAVRIEQA